MFKQITVANWRQFANVDIEFHNKLTILTGANASGKTTILRILAQHFGWQLQFINTSKRKSKSKKILEALADFWGEHTNVQIQQNQIKIGRISYHDGPSANLIVPSKDSQTYNVQISPLQPVPGLFIPSHRPIPIYKQIKNIPTNLQTKNQAFDNYKSEVLNRYMGGRGSPDPPSFRLKQVLVALATFGYGNEVVERSDEAVETFEGFQEILRKVLPPKIGFERISVRLPEVILETKSGDFSLDSMSGGISSIIDISWQIYMYSPEGESYTVTIDEPENHLHPELQRMLLPSFIDAFPSVQFIVATHNPFIVGAVSDSSVYVLDYNSNSKVESAFLDLANKAGTSNEILRSVLGLGDTLPLWVKSQMEEIIKKYSEQELTDQSLNDMRNELQSQGLDNVITEAISEVIERKNPK